MKLVVSTHGAKSPKDLGHYEVTVQSPVVLRGGRLTGRSVKRTLKVRAGSMADARRKTRTAGYKTILAVRRVK